MARTARMLRTPLLHARRTLGRPGVSAAALGLALGVGVHAAVGQQLTQPVYRVANQPAASPPNAAQQSSAAQQRGASQPRSLPQPRSAVQPAVATAPVQVRPVAQQAIALDPSPAFDAQVVPTAANQPIGPFDLEQRPGEHPLMPCLRLAKQAVADIRANIRDYSATLTKVERLNGQLGDPQQMEVRIRHQPFSVYTKFISPKPGQEALYVANQNNGKLVAIASGWKRSFGKVNLDPDGTMAMAGQRYPITKAGILNLTEELVQIAEGDVKYAECTVSHAAAKIAGRPATMIEAVHPVERRNFRFHKAQIFIDNELRMPVAYRAYSWPAQQGGEPVLEEQYVYTNVKINNGFTDADFSPENPAIFK
ncbi:MAG: DUF1571 domain-containing protein [Planctomycetota bacterium]